MILSEKISTALEPIRMVEIYLDEEGDPVKDIELAVQKYVTLFDEKGNITKQGMVNLREEEPE